MGRQDNYKALHYYLTVILSYSSCIKYCIVTADYERAQVFFTSALPAAPFFALVNTYLGS